MNVANRHREEVIAEAIFTRAKDYLENEPRLVRRSPMEISAHSKAG